MSADPITVLVLTIAANHPVTPYVADALAAAVRTRIETLLASRRGPLSSEEIDRIEFEVATELIVLAIAMMSRLPTWETFDLDGVGSAITQALAELVALREERKR